MCVCVLCIQKVYVYVCFATHFAHFTFMKFARVIIAWGFATRPDCLCMFFACTRTRTYTPHTHTIHNTGERVRDVTSIRLIKTLAPSDIVTQHSQPYYLCTIARRVCVCVAWVYYSIY